MSSQQFPPGHGGQQGGWAQQPPQGQGPQSGVGDPAGAGPGRGSAYGQGARFGPGSEVFGQPQGTQGQQTDAYGGQQQGGYGQQPGPHGQQAGAYGQQPDGHGQQAGAYGQQPGGYGQHPSAVSAMPQYGGPGMPYGAPVRPRKSRAPIIMTISAVGAVVLLVGGFFVAELLVRSSAVAALQAVAAASAIEQENGEMASVTVEAPEGLYLFRSGYDELVFTGGEDPSTTLTVVNQPSDLSKPAERIDAVIRASPEAFLEVLDIDGSSIEDSGFEHQLELRDGHVLLTLKDPTIPLVTVEITIELRAENGEFVWQATSTILSGGGLTEDLGSSPAKSGPICPDLPEDDAELTSIEVTTEGIDSAWTVSGESANLDNLTSIGSCLWV